MCVSLREGQIYKLLEIRTSPIQQSPSRGEADSHLATQEIPCLLWNPESSLPCSQLTVILSQFNPFHTFQPCFSKIHSNVVIQRLKVEYW
jgi:hypothetical protein